ncbi:MAG: DUF6328 family protein [Actinomycetota bacterium]
MANHEDHKERVDRELIELLNELRVALPGVQVLFAFLLILPFQQGFAKISGFDRGLFFASLLTTSASAALLQAPASWHRLRFRAGPEAKERMLFASNRMAIAGTVLLALSMTLVVYLITDVLFGAWAPFVAAGNALFFSVFWYVLPLSRGRGIGGKTPSHT